MDNVLDLSYEMTIRSSAFPASEGRGWLAQDIKPSDWTVNLDEVAAAEIRSMIDLMHDQPLPTILRRPDQFAIPHLTSAYHQLKSICSQGIGFAVLDRLPIDEFDIDDIVAVYWTLGHLIGRNVAQKWDGTMIYDVTDTGKKFGYGVRGSATNVELGFHTDNAFGVRVPDYVGLLCKYPADSGGVSRFCSLYTVHARMEARFPTELRRLYEIGRAHV